MHEPVFRFDVTDLFCADREFVKYVSPARRTFRKRQRSLAGVREAEKRKERDRLFPCRWALASSACARRLARCKLDPLS